MTKENCFVDDGTNITTGTTLPEYAYLPINHCNLPAVILGSLTYQQHPVALHLANINNIHRTLFSQLSAIADATLRAKKFMDYMDVYFQLDKLKQQHGEQQETDGYYSRARANYLSMLRGWLFDTDSREGAILKGWVESRFGLIPTWHKGRISNPDDSQYVVYLHERTAGIYNTNSLESQLDLLYSYSQFELSNKYNDRNKHVTLYRGINNKTAKALRDNDNILLLNNINSFSSTRERADEFGDITIQVKVPFPKIFYYSGLLPGVLHGENENIVIGGLYQVKICKDIK